MSGHCWERVIYPFLTSQTLTLSLRLQCEQIPSDFLYLILLDMDKTFSFLAVLVFDIFLVTLGRKILIEHRQLLQNYSARVYRMNQCKKIDTTILTNWQVRSFLSLVFSWKRQVLTHLVQISHFPSVIFVEKKESIIGWCSLWEILDQPMGIRVSS